MSDTQTETTEARQRHDAAQGGAGRHPGRHRGRAAASEETHRPPQGRHRRPVQDSPDR